MDKDFTEMQLKLNSSGSWSNVLRCGAAHEQEVKAACEALVKASIGRLKFKLLDAAGGELAHLGPPSYRWEDA